MSTPASVAARASAAFVTVWMTRVPRARRESMTGRGGIPNVKLTTGTGSRWSRSIFASH